MGFLWENRSGRLPTFWFARRFLEKSFRTPRTRRTKEIIDVSQHTQIKEVRRKKSKLISEVLLDIFLQIKKMSSRGEQTSKEIIRIHRCLEEAYENNHRSLD